MHESGGRNNEKSSVIINQKQIKQMAKKELTPIETLDNHPKIVKSGLVAFEKKKKEFALLAEKEKTFIINGIDDVEGYAAADEFRKKLKKERTTVTSEAKEYRDPFNAVAKYIISKENELIGVLSPAEKSLEAKLAVIDNEKAAKEAERQAQFEKVLAERKQQLIDAGFLFDGWVYHIQFMQETAESVAAIDLEVIDDEDFQTIIISGQEISAKIMAEKKAEADRQAAREKKAQEDAEKVKQLQKQLQDTLRDSAKIQLKAIGYIEEIDGMKHSVHGDLIYASRLVFNDKSEVESFINDRKNAVSESDAIKKQKADAEAKELENAELNTQRVENIKRLGLGEYFTVEEMAELFNLSEPEFLSALEEAESLKNKANAENLERTERLALDKEVLFDFIEKLRAVKLDAKKLEQPETRMFSEEMVFHINDMLRLADHKINNI